jgi:serine/threonine-protein kinase
MLRASMDAAGARPNGQIGRVIAGRWTLSELLGSGGTSVVYEAVHRNGKRVAIKVLSPERAANSRVRNRFLKEGYAANRVAHPRVVVVDDDGVDDDGTAYLVMQLLVGEPLDRYAARLGGSLPWQTVAQISLQLLDVLEAAHRAGIIHRDVKPGNLFWSAAEGLRVLDFGLARVTEPFADDSAERSRSATHDGVILGTPAFMAPEQARAASAAVGATTDLWAVGATAFSLLCGRKVYEAASVEEQIALAACTAAPSLLQLAPDAPPAFIQVLQRALEYEPDDRYPTAAAMAAAMRKALLAAGEALPPDVDTGDATVLSSMRISADLTRRPARSRLPLVRALVLATILGVAVLFAFEMRGVRSHDESVPLALGAAGVSPTSSLAPPSEELVALGASKRESTTAPASGAKRVPGGAPQAPSGARLAFSSAARTRAAPSLSTGASGPSGMIEQPPF